MSELARRVRERRAALGLSQEELADRMGYRSKSSITKLEKGVNDLPQSKLEELAAALDAMAAAIRWQRRPLPDILAALERYPLAGPYFHRITERMWEGQTLPQAWHSVFSRLSLGAEWMTALELTGDEEKLTNGLLYTAGQLKQFCRQRGEEQRQTAKLWLAGVLSAAGLLIILLI